MNKESVPLMYVLIYCKMVEKLGAMDKEVPVDKLIEIIRRMIYQIPKKYDYVVLKELESYDLLRKVNARKYLFYGKKHNNLIKKLDSFFAW